MKKSIVTMIIGGMMVGSNVFAGTTEINLQVVHKILEYGDRRAVDNLGEFFAENVRVHNSVHPEGKDYTLEEVTLGENKRVSTLFGQKWDLLDYFAYDNMVISYLLMHGVHVGEFMGLEETGKEFSTPVVLIYRFENGKICEVWNSWDKLDVVRQIGDVSIGLKAE